jgi:hypothetical protein
VDEGARPHVLTVRAAAFPAEPAREEGAAAADIAPVPGACASAVSMHTQARARA